MALYGRTVSSVLRVLNVYFDILFFPVLFRTRIQSLSFNIVLISLWVHLQFSMLRIDILLQESIPELFTEMKVMFLFNDFIIWQYVNLDQLQYKHFKQNTNGFETESFIVVKLGTVTWNTTLPVLLSELLFSDSH